MTSGLSGVLPSRDLKSLKSDDNGLCDGTTQSGCRAGRNFAVQKECPLRDVGDDMLWNAVVIESSKENTARIALDSNHGVM